MRASQQTRKVNVSEIWERQEGETTKSWQAFCVYRDIPPSSRTILAAYKLYSADKRRQDGNGAPIKRASQHFEKWASKFIWVDRANAYDAFLEKESRVSTQGEFLSELQGYRKRRLDFAKSAAVASENLLGLVKKKITNLKEEDILVDEIGVHVRTAVSLANAAEKAENEALGLDAIVVQLEKDGKF